MISLITLLGGGLMRLLPELLSYLNRRTDNAHELAMLDRQAALEQTRADNRMDEIQYQGDAAEVLAMLDAQKSALEGQMQKTGFRFVDSLNFLVRPFFAYTLLLFYYSAKLAMFMVAIRTGLSGWESILKIYTEADFAFLTGVGSFYFVGRSLSKSK